MFEQDINPEEHAILDAALAQQSRNILTNPSEGLFIVAQIALDASKEFGKSPLKAMQQLFDQHNFPVKFVAIPVDNIINKTGVAHTREGPLLSKISNYNVRMPHSGNHDYPFWLWTTIGRKLEYDDLLAQLETTPEENLERLTQTGMLFPREGTNISRAAQAGKN